MPQRIDVPGQGLIEFPDGMSDEQIVAAIKGLSAPEPTGSLAATGAGLGKGVGDFMLGAQDLVGKGLSAVGGSRAGQWLQDDANSGRARLAAENAPYQADHPILNGGGQIAGQLVPAIVTGNALGSVVSKFAPQLGSAISSAGMTTGAPSAPGAMNALMNFGTRAAGGAINGAISTGIVDPQNALMGAGIGAAAPGVMQLAGKAGGAIGSALRVAPKNPSLADKAVNQYGIPLGLSDVSDNAMVKGLRSVLDDTPGIGRIGKSANDAVQKGFNKAVGETFGAGGADSLTPQVLDAAKARMGGEFDRIWNGNALQVDAGFMQQLTGLQARAAKLPAQDGASIEREFQDILGKVTQDAQGNLIVPGDVANKFQSYLRRRAEGSAGLRNELGDLRQTIISAFNRSVTPADAAALTLTRSQYKAFKTVQPLLEGAEAGVAARTAGDVPAGLLPQAARKSYGSVAGTPFEDLSQIGSQYVADRVARTGGSARAMVQNSALGGALGVGAYANPLAALAALPLAAGVQKALTSPGLARSALSPSQQNALAKLLTDPALQQAVLRAAPATVADQ